MNALESDAFKIVVIGDSGAGKTSIIYRYAKDFFDPSYGTTIGTSFIVKKLDDYNITLNIWDTAGQERYRSMVPMYCHGASAILIIFDASSHSNILNSEFSNYVNSGSVTSQSYTHDSSNIQESISTSAKYNNDSDDATSSYQEVIDRWLSYVQQTVGDSIPIFIAGNKIDLINEEAVINQFKYAKNGDLVENNNFPIFLVSAKTGKNINLLFDRIAYQLKGNNKIKNNINNNQVVRSNVVQVHKCC